jgi:hypothetical protein
MKLVLVALLLMISIVPVFAQSVISFDVDTTKFAPGEIVELTGTVGTGLEGKTVAVEVNDSEGKIILIRTITSDINGNFSLKFKVPNDVTPGDLNIVTNVEMDGLSFSEEKYVEVTTSSDPICGTGTILKDGMCIVDTSKTSSKTSEKSSKGGGCLIATATYGSELAPEVQKLRELRDNSLLSTESGTNFMSTFNDIYYTFSPIIADYERENPVFKEMVKIAITPMISSLSILNYVDMDSESSVLRYGISLIVLNAMMYIGVPVVAIMKFKK